VYSGADPTVTAEGYGKDRDDALLHARREALAQGIGMMLTSETEVNNFMLKRDIVLSKTMGSVKKVTILEEKKEAADRYYVKIQAIVSADSIKKDLMALQILLSSLDYPRMLVQLENDPGNLAKVVLTDYFISRGFTVVEPSAAINRAGLSTGTPDVVAQLGQLSGADYVITGSVNASPVSSDFMAQSGLQSCRATITSRIISSRSGKVFASRSAGSSAAHLSSGSARNVAVEKAAAKLMDEKLFDQLIGAFQDSLNNGFSLQVTVTNVQSYDMQKNIRELIKDMDPVSLHKKSYSQNLLELMVVFEGNGDAFCDAINGRDVAGYKLFVDECSGDIVGLRLESVQ
jgi:hypothetical protein